MKRVVLLVLVAAAALYLGDYGWLWLRGRRGAALGSVSLDTYYTAKLKSGKTEFDYVGQQAIECVRSLFPHWGDQPCWYVSRKKEQHVDIDSGDPHNPKLF
jgi:hypothetical protein